MRRGKFRVNGDTGGKKKRRGISTKIQKDDTHVFLLFVHVADLEPYVHLTQWVWRVTQDLVEALDGGFFGGKKIGSASHSLSFPMTKIPTPPATLTLRDSEYRWSCL